MTPAEIIAFRKRLGLTQARFAALLPAPKRTIENWEGGRRNPPAYLQRALRDLEMEISTALCTSRRL
jgi:putative transcriptional regulator